MLRRKKRSQRPPREGHPPAPGGARSRRRARPDAEVPPELILAPEAEREVRKPAKEEPQKQKPPARAAKPEAPARAPAPPRPPAAGPGVILVTGFEPFGGEALNPSWEICKRLRREIAGRRVETCRVPCEFRTAIEVVAEAIERHQPEIVLSVGQAGGRAQVGVERIAINVDDARAPDNAGYQPIDEPVAENGPPAYFSTLPVKVMVEAMRGANVPAELSNTAGTYVCNHLMYGVLHFLAASGNGARAGFVHVPYSEEQLRDKRGVPGMSLATMVRGIEAALEAASTNTRDIATPEGTLD